ncbi:MAG: hypothetical protein KatS3mg029_0073 [Saprospiraceae bacterium]|nr:MAG: hypothetical protein KatS3mg029_0073 [Saprospiraceae bacterium]
MNPPGYSNQDKGQTPPAQNQGNAPQPQAEQTPTRKRNGAMPVLIAVGVLMLGAVGWLTYTSVQTTRSLEQKVAELEEAQRLQAELETQYFSALSELDRLKGENAEINTMIDQQKAELEEQRNQISKLLRDKRNLDAARAEIANLKAQIDTYVAEIERLTMEQEQLRQQNEQLTIETSTLSTNLQRTESENQSLKEYQAKLVNEREELAKAVRIGSVVKVKDIKVTGEKLRNNGKAVERRSANRVDQLRVCFTTVENAIVEPGTERFYIRIINPKGETLAIDDLGSGVLEHTATGEPLLYSQVQEHEYTNEETQLCFAWKPGIPLQSGKYEVEIYNKGYLAGKSSFELK